MSKIKLLLFSFMLLLSAQILAQGRVVTGKIVSVKDGSPVSGATVSAGGGSGLAVSPDGTFSVNAPSGSFVLNVSSIGFLPKAVNVGSSENNLTIVLEEDAKSLDAVVVTALGITRRQKSLVYATQTVKPSELTEARDANNVLNSLSGKVANAVINQGSGGPGSGARIVLRGNRSIQGSNNALIVVDGVPINNSTLGTAGSDFGSVQGSDGASNINPDDIESVTVLRGASAAALYGSQAGNGVIVITTKKGKSGKVSVSLNSGVTMESVFAIPDVQNTYGQGNGNQLNGLSGESWGAKMEGQSFTNFLGQASSYNPQSDNIRDFFRNGVSVNNSIGLSGGTEKVQTYFSYTNNYIQGIVPNNDLRRHTVNFRITNQIGSRFTTDAKVTYINQYIMNRPRTGEENSPVMNTYNMGRSISTADAQQYEVLDNLGVPAPTPFPSTLSSIYQNPYWVINRTSINEARDRVIGFINAKYKLTNWLSLSGRANLDKTFDFGETKISQGTILYASPGGQYTKNNIQLTDQWYDVMLEGNNNITSDLAINYRVGGIFQDNRYDANFTAANGLNITNKFSMNFAKAPSASSSYVQVQTQSAFAQANFSFKDAIFLDASIRNDWDSRLVSPYTYLYPSVGVSAVLSDLLTMPTAISFLKASVNYAEVGNGGLPQLTNTVYGYSQGAGLGFLQRSPTLPFPELKPEIVKNLEIGLEARFINNRIGFTATFYKSNSVNQLLRIALPVATGFNSQYINAGNIQNTGFELVINGSVIRKSNFNWDMAFNLGTNTNKVINLDPNIKIVYLGGGFGRSATPVVEEGKAFGDLLAFKWATDAKGNKVVDATTGKPTLTQAQEYIGNFNPKATLGFTNTLTYKNFSFRLLLDGRVGGTIVSGTEMNLAFSGIPEVTESYREGNWNLGGVSSAGAPVTKPINAQDFWQIASGKRYGAGEFFAYNATNFRARELSLGYTLPIRSQKIVQSVKVSLVGRNLFWIYRGSSLMDIPGLGTRKMWFDPDMSLGNGNFQGVEYGTLPSTRSFGFNVNVIF